MSDEQINIAIAEVCGWEPSKLSTDMAGNPFDGWDEPPNYCNDLNAMHEAEKVLGKKAGYYQKGGFGRYIAELGEVCGGGEDALTATARQRAEAFLKTVGKWEDVK